MSDSDLQEDGTRRLGRPREFDRGAVLDAAVDVFWRYGFQGATTRQLEQAIGLRPSSLYNTFGSKRGLLDAALDRYEEMTGRELLVPLEDSSDGLAAIDRFLVALGRWVTEQGRGGCMLINLMAEDGGQTAAVTARAGRYRQTVRDALERSLARAAAAGEIAAGSEPGRTDLLFGLILGLNIAARGGAAPAEVDRLLAAARDLLETWRLEPAESG